VGLTDIREQIKAMLSAVEGVGVVHDYERWATEWNKFLRLFKDAEGKINGWTFVRAQTAQRQATLGEIDRAHVIRFRGYAHLRDAEASEIVFQGVIDRLIDKFNEAEAENLGGACLTTHPDWGPMAGAVGLQIDRVEPRKFGAVLCHYAEGRLCALETVEC